MRTENNSGSSISDDNVDNDDCGDDSEPKEDQFDEEECNADLTVQDGGGREERYGNRYNRDKHFTETSYDITVAETHQTRTANNATSTAGTNAAAKYQQKVQKYSKILAEMRTRGVTSKRFEPVVFESSGFTHVGARRLITDWTKQATSGLGQEHSSSFFTLENTRSCWHMSHKSYNFLDHSILGLNVHLDGYRCFRFRNSSEFVANNVNKKYLKFTQIYPNLPKILQISRKIGQ